LVKIIIFIFDKILKNNVEAENRLE